MQRNAWPLEDCAPLIHCMADRRRAKEIVQRSQLSTDTLQHSSIHNHISQYSKHNGRLCVQIYCKICQSSSDVIAKRSVHSVRDGRVVICDVNRHHPRESDKSC